MSNLAREYIRAGWLPIPLPAGKKYPPPDGTTGRVPDMSPASSLSLFDDAPDGNIGLRLTGDVVGIDVDNYGAKTGAATLAGLVAKLGALPNTFKSSSRGAGSPSGIYLFRVPAGLRWRGKVGADVELIQRGHRYMVAAPSVVGGRSYRWYSPDGHELDGPPLVTELATLPETWQKFLLAGSAQPDRTKPAERVSDPRGWLARNVPGFQDEPSSELRRATSPDVLAAAMAGGAHDELVRVVHRVIQLGAEGHSGLGAALAAVEAAFAAEVADRRPAAAEAELGRAVGGAVAALQEELADGTRLIGAASYRAEDADVDTGPVLAGLARWDVLADVDVNEFRDNDTGRGKLFLKSYNGQVRGLTDSPDFMCWSGGRWAAHDVHRVGHSLWEAGVSRPLELAADELEAEATALGDTDEAKDLRQRAKDFRRRAVAAGNLNQIKNGLALARVNPDYARPSSAWDRSPLLGAERYVIDIQAFTESGKLADLKRFARQDDMVSKSVGFDFDPWATGPFIEKYLPLFLPDEQLRRDMFRVLGAAALTVGNPLGRIVILRGAPSTGKSTMLDLLGGALGAYADTASSSVFRAPQNGNASPELAAVLDLRAVVLSESSQRDHLHADVLKRITGVLDKVSVRRLYSNNIIQKTPDFTPIMATNEMPSIGGADQALKKRLLVLPFDFQHLDGPLQGIPLTDADRSHVLRLLVEGLVDFLRRGLVGLHPAIAAATNEAFADTSPFQSWRAEFLVESGDMAPGQPVAASKAWEHFAQWQETAKLRPADRLDKREFASHMRDAFGVTRQGNLKGPTGKWRAAKVYQLARWANESDD